MTGGKNKEVSEGRDHSWLWVESHRWDRYVFPL